MKTVKDLIKKLQTFDENLPVFIDGYEYGIDNIKLMNIRQRRVKLNVNEDVRFGGPHEESRVGEIEGIIIGRTETKED